MLPLPTKATIAAVNVSTDRRHPFHIYNDRDRFRQFGFTQQNIVVNIDDVERDTEISKGKGSLTLLLQSINNFIRCLYIRSLKYKQNTTEFDNVSYHHCDVIRHDVSQKCETFDIAKLLISNQQGSWLGSKLQLTKSSPDILKFRTPTPVRSTAEIQGTSPISS